MISHGDETYRRAFALSTGAGLMPAFGNGDLHGLAHGAKP